MVLPDRALAAAYRLSIVTMSPSAVVWLQFSMGSFKLSGHILEMVRDRAKVTINH